MKYIRPLLIGMLLFSGLSTCHGQVQPCPGGECPTYGAPSYGRVQRNTTKIHYKQADEPNCIIFVSEGGGRYSRGSGTAIDHTDKQTIILTCAHLFTDSRTGIIVEFSRTGKRVEGKLIEIDEHNDLAAVAIPRQDILLYRFSHEASDASDKLWIMGHDGQSGRFGVICESRIVGHLNGGQFVELRGQVRGGFSGGCVVNEDGKLVGVVWGASNGTTCCTAGKPLRTFIKRVMRGVGRVVHGPPDNVIIEAPNPGGEQDNDELISVLERIESKVDSRLNDIDSRLVAVENRELQPGPEGPRGPKGEQGERGPQGPPGENASPEQIRQFVDQYIEENPIRVRVFAPDGSQVGGDEFVTLGGNLNLHLFVPEGE